MDAGNVTCPHIRRCTTFPLSRCRFKHQSSRRVSDIMLGATLRKIKIYTRYDENDEVFFAIHDINSSTLPPQRYKSRRFPGKGIVRKMDPEFSQLKAKKYRHNSVWPEKTINCCFGVGSRWKKSLIYACVYIARCYFGMEKKTLFYICEAELGVKVEIVIFQIKPGGGEERGGREREEKVAMRRRASESGEM